MLIYVLELSVFVWEQPQTDSDLVIDMKYLHICEQTLAALQVGRSLHDSCDTTPQSKSAVACSSVVSSDVL